MTDHDPATGPDKEAEQYPIEPRYHPVNRLMRILYDALASSKLAMALLVIILVCCLAGVTLVRGQRAWEIIFSTLWFNGILVLLVVNVAFCFFGRIRGRKITLVSLGMILFHLSFLAILAGIVYNSLFYFRALMRVTEEETVANGALQSYDIVEQGRFFALSKFKGETTLIRMHREYATDSHDKIVAYEIESTKGGVAKKGIVYITHSFERDGFSYYNEKEGYSLLIMFYDKQGRDLYGAHVPLQSLKQKEDMYLYTTGTRNGPGSIPFPQEPLKPLFALQAVYLPSPLQDRSGEVLFTVKRITEMSSHDEWETLVEEQAPIGKKIKVDEHYISVTEVRYWVGMMVRYDPGKPIVLASLWVGLGGMLITFIGRMRKSGR